MKRQILVFSIVAAMICTIIFATVQLAYSQNATKGGNACMSCGPITGTNLTNGTKGGYVTNAIISLNDAKRIITAAEKKAVDIGQPMNIAVVDSGGNLIAHERMDGAWIGSIDISINKAFTSRAFDIATKDLAKESQPGGQFFGIHESNEGRIMIFAGGIPLKLNGQVVGAIGVSGGSGQQDQSVAEAGAAAF